MTLYPIFLKLEDKKVLIVGGGQIAEDLVRPPAEIGGGE